MKDLAATMSIIYPDAFRKASAPDAETRGSQDGGAPRTVKPRLNVSVLPPSDASSAPARQLKLEGRQAWMLNELVKAGTKGVTSAGYPGARVSHYIFGLRRLGVAIETRTTKHGGSFAGSYGTYVLTSRVRITLAAGLNGNPQRVSA